MVPVRFYDFADSVNNSKPEYSDRTYSLSNMRRFVEGRQAVCQAAVKILSTERGRYPVYSRDYGIESQDLFGKSCDYVCAELQRRITEALTADLRITGVSDFTFDVCKGIIYVKFAVHSIFGDLQEGLEFSYV